MTLDGGVGGSETATPTPTLMYPYGLPLTPRVFHTPHYSLPSFCSLPHHLSLSLYPQITFIAPYLTNRLKCHKHHSCTLHKLYKLIWTSIKCCHAESAVWHSHQRGSADSNSSGQHIVYLNVSLSYHLISALFEPLSLSLPQTLAFQPPKLSLLCLTFEEPIKFP